LLPAVLAAESASYVTVDQYQAILTRYTEAEATRLIVVNADTKDALAASNATDTATAASLIGVYNQNQLMMMGV
jgi:Trk K+ transport system NAD-binding subunit